MGTIRTLRTTGSAIAVALGALGLVVAAACAPTGRKVSLKKDSKSDVFEVECGFLEACHAEAQRVCRSGYDTVTESSGSTRAVDQYPRSGAPESTRSQPSWWFAAPTGYLKFQCRW